MVHPPGTKVPEDLILVHEGPGREEWSLQPAREMTLDGKLIFFTLLNHPRGPQT